MSEQIVELLPFEFARTNRLLLREVEGDLILAPGTPDWAIAEVGRITGADVPVERVDDETFDQLISCCIAVVKTPQNQ
jgi:general secretion pathway protein E